MKEENMKLLDLQTGNYLELGKDFYYGCNTIMLHCYTKEELTEYQQRDDYNPHYLIYDTDYNNPEKYHKIIHNGFQEAIDRDTATVRLFTEHKSEPQGILKTLCDKTGAVIYGGRYVLLNGERDTSIHDDNHFYKIGDVVVNEYNCYGCVTIGLCSTEYSYHNNVVDIPELRGNCESGVLCCKFEILGNLFEEYSKQLRKEENKFDELMEKLK